MADEDLLSELAIVRVLNRYASAVDRIDLELLESCFFENAQATYAGRVLPPGIDHIKEVIAGLKKVSGTIHNLGPILVDILGDDASAHAGCLVLAVSDAAAHLGVMRGVRYAFQLRREDEEWRIATLRHEILWASAAPRSDMMGRSLEEAETGN